DSAVQDEMHGVGWIPLAYDNFVRLNLYPLTTLNQLVSLLCPAERFSKPLVQGVGLAFMRLVRLDNRVLTGFKRSVEIGRHNDLVGNKSGGMEGVFHARCQSAGHGNRLISSKFKGSVSETAAWGLNSQPAACASVIEMPIAKKARCVPA